MAKPMNRAWREVARLRMTTVAAGGNQQDADLIEGALAVAPEEEWRRPDLRWSADVTVDIASVPYVPPSTFGMRTPPGMPLRVSRRLRRAAVRS